MKYKLVPHYTFGSTGIICMSEKNYCKRKTSSHPPLRLPPMKKHIFFCINCYHVCQ